MSLTSKLVGTHLHITVGLKEVKFYLLFKKNVMYSSYLLGKLIKNVGGNDFLPRKLNLIKKLKLKNNI